MATTFKDRLHQVITVLETNPLGFSKLLEYEQPEKIYRLLRDGDAKPSFDVIQDISNKFEWLNIQWLINGKGKMSNTPDANRDNQGDSVVNEQIPGTPKEVNPSPTLSATLSPTNKLGYRKASNKENITSEEEAIYTSRMPRIVTINEHGIDNIVYVPVKARAGYLLGHGDKEFIETLPTFRMPGLNNSTYRMFEVEGLSMSGTLSDRDRVIGEWVPSIDQIRENRVHVIVTTDGVLIKRLLNRVKERGCLYLKSDTITHRQDYPIKELDPADVQEIWYVNLKVSSDLSEPAEIYKRVSDLEIFKYELMKKLGIPEGH